MEEIVDCTPEEKPKPIKKSFSDLIREKKEERNWTDSELARQASRASGRTIHRQTIWYALNKAKQLPTVETIAALAKAFGCSVEELAA